MPSPRLALAYNFSRQTPEIKIKEFLNLSSQNLFTSKEILWQKPFKENTVAFYWTSNLSNVTLKEQHVSYSLSTAADCLNWLLSPRSGRLQLDKWPESRISAGLLLKWTDKKKHTAATCVKTGHNTSLIVQAHIRYTSWNFSCVSL